MRGEVGNNGLWQAAFAGGGAIVDDVLAIRIAGSWRENDGFLFNTFLNEEADRHELRTGRVKFLFEPTDSFRVITTTSYTENFGGEDVVNPTNGVPGALLDASEVIREVSYDTPGLEGTDTILQSVNATWEINDKFEIQSITAFQSSDYVRQEDFDVTPLPIAALDRTGEDRAISEELRLKYNGDRLSGVLGFYFVDTHESFDDDDFNASNKNLHLYLAWSKPEHHETKNRGRIDADKILKFANKAKATDVFICGPTAMMDQLRQELTRAGVPKRNLNFEAFAPPPKDLSKGGEFNITFEPAGVSITSQPGESILETAERAGLEIDYSCRSGTCGLCQAKLAAGEVELAIDDALEEDDIDAGVILTCQSFPRKRCTINT